MTEERPTAAQRAQELLARLADSPLGAGLRDENQRRRAVFDLLATSDTPVVRELGHELGAGNIGVRASSDVPAYREVLDSGLRRLAALDLDAVTTRIEQAMAAVPPSVQPSEPPSQPPVDDDEEFQRPIMRDYRN